MNEPAPTENIMGVAFYNLAGQRRVTSLVSLIPSDSSKDMAVRQCISKAEVARHSFKDKAIEQVDVLFFYLLSCTILTHIKAISVAYQVTVDAIIKCLRLFAEDQQYLHSFVSLVYH